MSMGNSAPRKRTAWEQLWNTSSDYFRRKRGRLFVATLPNFTSLKVLDVGGSRHFWEKQDPAIVPSNLTLVNIKNDGQAKSYSGTMRHMEVIVYDGQTLPFDDKSFDVIVCNSVIEHVPPQQRARVVQEILRVAKFYFIQTPAFVFPIEPHFFCPGLHWLPRSVGRRAVRLSPWRIMSRPSEQHIKKYFEEIQILRRAELIGYAPNSKIFIERFLGIPKSYTIYGPNTEHFDARSKSARAD
jgi:SAM-dependent methyltransferase